MTATVTVNDSLDIILSRNHEDGCPTATPQQE